MYQSNRSFNIPQAFDTFAVPRRREFDYQSLPGGGEIWFPCVRGGELELPPRFCVKSLAWRTIMGDKVLEDFHGNNCAFVANWLRGKDLNKLCAILEGIWTLIFVILDSGFEYMRKGLKQALCHIRRHLNSNIFTGCPAAWLLKKIGK